MKPEIEVLVISYNQEKYISSCIESILCQECDVPFRILISDDNSTDDTVAILKEYQNRYPDKVILLRSPINQGVSKNFEKVIRSSSAPLVAFCEGDDFWADRYKLHKQITAYRQSNSPSFIYSDFHRCTSYQGQNYLFRNSARSVGDPPISGFIFTKLLNSINIHLSTILCQRSLAVDFLNSDCFDPGCQLADVPLILFLAASGKAVGLNDSLSVYRHNRESITNRSLDSKLRIQIEHLNYLYKFSQKYNSGAPINSLAFPSQIDVISSTAYAARKPLVFIRYQRSFKFRSLMRLVLIILPFFHRLHLKRSRSRQFQALISESVPFSLKNNPFRISVDNG